MNTLARSNDSLIPVFPGQIGGQSVMVCDGRDLHSFLQVGKTFAAWIKARISKYGFEENIDFRSFSQNGKKPTGISASQNGEAQTSSDCFPNRESKKGRGGHNRLGYHLTLDMAKELAMVENNDQGRQARRYFIEMERKALDAAHRSSPSLPREGDHANAELITLRYQERHFRMLLNEGQLWYCAADVAHALGLRDSHLVTRHLKAHQVDKLWFGKQWLRTVNEQGLHLAFLHAESKNVEPFKAWLQNAIATVAPMSASDVQTPPIDGDVVATDIPAAKDALRSFLHRTRFLVSVDLDGQLVIKEMDDHAMVTRPDELPAWIRDPAGCPDEVLPQLLAAISQRLGGA